MWVKIAWLLVLYEILRWIFYSDDDAAAAFPDIDTSDADACFAVAARLEKVYGGKAFVGLRIPDADAGTREHIDVVLLTKSSSQTVVMVVAVRNFSGSVEVGKDGNWLCSKNWLCGLSKNWLCQTYPNPVRHVWRQVDVLESYLEQRGVRLPKGHVIGRVILPHSNCRTSDAISFRPEVVSFETWTELKPSSGLFNWIKRVVCGLFNWIKGVVGKSEMQDGFYQKLHFILSTSPMWDRLELEGDRNILGEFLEFKGRQDDIEALRNVKRSKVGRLIVQKPTMFSLDKSRVQVLYCPRDYRSEGASSSEGKDVAVEPSTEVLFQPRNSKQVKKVKLSCIISVALGG